MNQENDNGGMPRHKRIKREIDQSSRNPHQERGNQSTSHTSASRSRERPTRITNRIQDAQNESCTSLIDDEPMSDGVNEAGLVKAVAQCIVENASKRGFVRDADIAEMFTNRQERDTKESVLKRVEKLLKDIFGYRLVRDDEAKRYYLSTNLHNGVEIAQGLINAPNEQQNEIDYEIDTLEVENAYTKDFLLQISLIFIFMTKRQSGISSEMEKGVDQVLLKDFLNEMFNDLGTKVLSDKQFGEWFGPAKSADFISQGWLRCDIRKDQTTGNEELFYHWGPRAETVISKKKLLESFCEIYGTNLNNWPNHARVAGFRGTAQM